MTILIEACVDSVASALAAQDGGAGRIELCDALVEGGLTPSAGKIAMCCERLTIPVVVLIRPRSGDFLYGDTDTELMFRDIEVAKRLGAKGIAIGALRPDGTIDEERMKLFIAAARPMEVVFHRAFDGTPDPFAALETLVKLGVDRVLTSGQGKTAADGTLVLEALVTAAKGRIAILAGGGVDETNAPRLVTAARVQELHIRGTTAVVSEMTYKRPGFDLTKPPMPDNLRAVTDATRVRATVRAVNGGSSR